MTATETQAPTLERKDVQSIVGIGVSAGGLEALQQFFVALPGNSGMSFVVVQHLSSEQRILMAEMLSRYTDIPVRQAENGMVVEPDTVYIIPAEKNMTVSNGRFLLSENESGDVDHSIDSFFTSLAESQQDRSLAVILSGAGVDGTGGARAVKEHGGLVFVQEPKSAQFDGMPQSAIHAGLADFVMPPHDIADELLNIIHYPGMSATEHDSGYSEDEDTLTRIYMLLKKASGIDFTYYKRSTLFRRIERRMMVTHCTTPSCFARLLEENADEVSLLVKDLLIGVTRFFRDAEFFETLKATAVTNILEGSAENEPIRVWSAGCSTGEEAYSLAILFHEVMEEKGLRRDVKIFATDVDTGAIEHAGKGVFPESVAEDISPERLARYFVKRNGQYHIAKNIRKMIIFAPHNMLSDPPFGKLALISCRNVLIYFQPVLQKGVFAIFHSALNNGGYLFLGKSETAGEYGKVFSPVSAMEKIYVHRSDGTLDDVMPLSFSMPDVRAEGPGVPLVSGQPGHPFALEDVYTRFLEKFLPASVVIDEQNTVIHFFGNYADYLNIAPGKATFNFFSLVNRDICLVASTAVSRCRHEGRPVTYTGIAVDTPVGRRVIDLSVHPVTDASEMSTGLLAVLFGEQSAAPVEGVREKYDIDATAAQRIASLERELQVSQNDLRRTVAELEGVNGELQAANEELLTANEELQSSNEEIQSVNAELSAVNAEFRQKLGELTTMNNDLSNFLSSTMIGILLVDSRLNIRKFTEYIGREFQLDSQDVNRPLQIFARCFPDEDIIKDAGEVLSSQFSVDREVTGMNGRCYTMRIAPYRTTENSVHGLVFTVIDSLGADAKRAVDQTPDNV